MGKKSKKIVRLKSQIDREIEVKIILDKMVSMDIEQLIPLEIKNKIENYVKTGESFYIKDSVPQVNRVFEYIFNNKANIISTINLLYKQN